MFETQELPATEIPASSVSLPAPPPQPVHLLDRLNAVFKHRRLAGTSFVVVVTLMMIQTYSTVPIFQASSRVLIQDERTTQVVNLNTNDPAFWQDADQYYKTQYSILQSRGLAQRVVKRLDLAHHPEFSGAGPRPRDPISLIRQARAAASGWIRSLVSKPSPAVVPPPGADEDSEQAALVSAFLGGVTVVPEQGTRLVTLYYRHSNPEFAAQAASTLAEEYTQQNLDLRLQNTDKMLAWITTELKRQEDQLGKSEGDLTTYRESRNALSLEDRQNIVVQRLNTLNDSVTRARTARLSKETAYSQLKGASPNNDSVDAFPLVGANPGGRRGEEQAARRAGRESVAGEPELRARMAGDEDRGGRHRGGTPPARRRTDERDRIGQERIQRGARRRAQPVRIARGGQGRLDGSRSEERRLSHPPAQGGQRSPGVSIAARAAEGAAGRRQQPREQRAGDGARRGAEVPDLAQPAAGLDHRDPRRV